MNLLSNLKPALCILLAAALLPVTPAGAQDEAAAPAFSDGRWQAVMQATSHVEAVSSIDGEMHGEAQFVVSEGVLDGEWFMQGTGVITGEFSGTAEQNSTGVVSGGADLPIFTTASGSIHISITGPGGTAEFTETIPAGDTAFTVILTHATCTQVIGEWEVSASNMSGAGTFVATRVADVRSGSELDYEGMLDDLLRDLGRLSDSAADTGSLDVGELHRLLTGAQELNRLLRRAGDCAAEPPPGTSDYLTILANVMAELLRVALAHPFELEDEDLRLLAQILVASGALPSVSDTDLGELIDQIELRLGEAIAAGDEAAIGNLTAAAASLGEWDLVELGSAALREE